MNRSDHVVRDKCSLVINVAPSDIGLCEHTVPHQIRQFSKEVDEILLAVDGLNSGGRFGEGWKQKRNALTKWLGELSGCRIIEVDYGNAARMRSAEQIGMAQHCPEKDYRGGPYHAYFFGVASALHPLVFHSDSDMLYGGRGIGWITEASKVLAQPGVLSVSPLPGPPTSDGALVSQWSEPYPGFPHAHRFRSISTRVFLLDRRVFGQSLAPWLPSAPGLRGRLRALIDGRPAVQLPERDISTLMARKMLCRVDMLGQHATRWSLHPPYRTPAFMNFIPSLIRQVESGDLPEGQSGCHDISDVTFDWTEARRVLRDKAWYRRLLRRNQ